MNGAEWVEFCLILYHEKNSGCSFSPGLLAAVLRPGDEYGIL